MMDKLLEGLISSIISLGSLFFPFIQGVEPDFADLRLAVQRGQLYLATRIVNCYSEDLDKVLMSGQEIQLCFRVEVKSGKSKKAVLTRNFYHSMRYNIIDQLFSVYLSERDIDLQYHDINSVHDAFTQVEEVAVLGAADLKAGKSYIVEISAHLDPVTFVGSKEKIDLMLFWNNKRPVLRSEPFTDSIFQF